MYLLMMLATFISAIYGFNLSVRPDYDRDIVRKKASSMLYRFNYQAYAVSKLVARLEMSAASHVAFDGEHYTYGIQPGDEIYSTQDSILTYKRSDLGTTHEFLLQGNNTGEHQSMHLLPEGRDLYSSDEMYSRIYCLPYNPARKTNYNINDYDGNYHPEPSDVIGDDGEPVADVAPPDGKQNCDSNTDDGGGVVGSCCKNNTHRYIVTVRKMDARWINRLTNFVNSDFQRAVIEYPFSENIGFVYRKGNQWQFEGRIKLLPVYIDDLRAWEEAHKNETDLQKRQFPTRYRNKHAWQMPRGFFTDDFFTFNGDAHFCDNGCLFKIKQI